MSFEIQTGRETGVCANGLEVVVRFLCAAAALAASYSAAAVFHHCGETVLSLALGVSIPMAVSGGIGARLLRLNAFGLTFLVLAALWLLSVQPFLEQCRPGF